MKVGESQELLVQFEQDLAAEENPDIRTWYEQEFKLQPDYLAAEMARDNLGALALQLGKILAVKEQEGSSEVTEDDLVEAVEEQPRILTQTEIAQLRLKKKYDNCLSNYEKDIADSANLKRSKREHQERMAKRKLIKNFVDTSDINGEDHIVLDPTLLMYASSDLLEDEELINELFKNCADYTENHGLEVTRNPGRFALIIGNSVDGILNARGFDSIVRAAFSRKQSPEDLLKVTSNLAEAVYDLLLFPGAQEKVGQIINLDGSYVPKSIWEKMVEKLTDSILSNDLESFWDLMETNAVFTHLTVDILGLDDNRSLWKVPPTRQFSQKLAKTIREDYPVDENGDYPNRQVYESILRNGNYDEVDISNPEGEKLVNIENFIELPEEFKKALHQSTKYQKRIKYLAPHAYSVMAATHLVGEGVCGEVVPVSPSITINAYIPGYPQPEPSVMRRGEARLSEILPSAVASLLTNRVRMDQITQEGNITVVCEPLYATGREDGILAYRRQVPSDLAHRHPLYQLTMNFINSNQQGFTERDQSEKQAENERLREDISAQQKRFLGRRPVEFTMPESISTKGLNKIALRYNPKSLLTEAVFKLSDGNVMLHLDKNFSITKDNETYHGPQGNMQAYYENLILKALKHWMCENEVQTSEGTVSEQSGNSANMGHYGYLRIRESDGRRYRFSEQQRAICLEEQKKDIAIENERLRLIDPTGRGRNSTYIRENYDPSKPPLEIYYPSDLLN